MKRRRVPVSGESSPRMTVSASSVPRCESARSTRNAASSATTIGTTTDAQLAPSSRIAATTMPGSGVDMGGEVRRRAVLLDAMGTLLRLEDPAPRLRAALLARLGVDVGRGGGRGGDARRDRLLPRAPAPRSRRGLARRAARRVRRGDAAGAAARGRGGAARRADGRAAGRARVLAPIPTRAPALRALRAAGHARSSSSRTGTVSLHERLEETGLAPLVDASVASAEVGRGQAGARDLRARAGARGRRRAERAWHVGDSLRDDVEGARAAGIRAGPAGARATRGAGGSAPPAGVPAPAQPGRIARPRRARRPLRLCGPDVELPASLRRTVPRRCRRAPSCPRACGGPSRRRRGGRDGLPRWPLWAPFAAMLGTLIVAVVGVGVIALVVELAGVDTGERHAARRHDRRHLRAGPRADRLGAAARAAARPAARRRASSACASRACAPRSAGRCSSWVGFFAFATVWGARARHHRGGRPARGARRRRVDGGARRRLAARLRARADRGGAVLPRLLLHRAAARARACSLPPL